MNMLKTLLMGLLLAVSLISAPVAFAGGDGDHAEHVDFGANNPETGAPNWRSGEHSQLYGLAMHSMNLLILLGILGFFAGRPIADAVRNRALGIRKGLTDSARERDEAKQRFEEVEARLAAFADELTAMREKAVVQAKEEEEELVHRAHEEAERIAQSAQRTIREEATRARVALRRDAVELAVKLAEEIVKQKISADNQKQLATEFLASIEQGGVRG
jgi:F-type H+-transporting ATPase subunit b